MSINYVDTYINNLPRYVAFSITIQSERAWQSRHDYLYRELLRDLDNERQPPLVSTTMTGDPAAWRYIDFDPYEAWLGPLTKPLRQLRVETWECRKGTWDPNYREEDE